MAQKNITKPNVPGPNDVSVNTYTGGLFYQRQDLMIPGRGLSIDLTFSYNTVSRERDWGLGRGWTFNYNMAYSFDSLDVVIEHMDGSRNRYLPNGSGGWYCPSGVFDSLEQYQPDQFVLTQKDGMRYYFDEVSHRKLTRLEDRNGNTISLAYTDSLLTTITDPTGRQVFLSWTDGRLSKITDPNASSPREIIFTYDVQGNPTSVQDALGNLTEYEYDNQFKLTTIVNKNGNPVNINYGYLDAVREVVSCVGKQTFTYNYENLKTYLVEEISGQKQITTYLFNEGGQLVQQKGNCCGYNVVYEYDESNNITKRIDANGNATSFVYDDRGNVLQEIDPLGNAVSFTYEPTYNQLTSIQDKNGSLTTFAYDPNGNLVAINSPLNIMETFAYNAFGEKISYTDGKSNITSYEYNANGDLTKIINAIGGQTLFGYDNVGNMLTNTDPNGNLMTMAYDLENRMINITDALSNTESHSYDANSNRIQVIDKEGKISQYSYDALGRLIEKQDALGFTESYTYDAKGNLLSYIDQNGHQMTYEYDNLNRRTSDTNAEGESHLYDYDTNGNLTMVVLPNGNTVNIQYDALNRVREVTDAIGLVASFSFDANSNKLSETDGNGNTSTFTYDALHRLISVTDPFSEALVYSYDNNYNLTSTTDRGGKVTSYTYDALDRQVTITDALNFASTYDYDAFGNLISVSDPKNQVTNYTYDALNRRKTEVNPDGTSTTYNYDATGHLTSQVNPNNETTTYTYDNRYRLLNRSYSNGEVETFAYDPAGNLINAQNQYNNVVLTYDAVNRVVRESLNGRSTSFNYSMPNRSRTITYPGGRQVVEQLDERARLTSVTDNSLLQDVLANYTYDNGNRKLSQNYLNNAQSNFSYDANSRLLSVGHTLNSLVQFDYAYDKIGNRLNEQRLHNPNRSREFIYDNLNRLTEDKTGQLAGNTIPSPTSQFQYVMDALGNRSRVNENATNTTYTNNNLNQYTTLSGGINAVLNYDDNGNLTADGAQTYQYDIENRLVSVDNGSTAHYRYDPLGRRTHKIIGTDTTFYYYDNLRVIEERDNNDFAVATYVYGERLDEVISMHRNGQDYYYHHDGLGSVVAISNASNVLIEAYEYDAYGKPMIFDGSNNPLATSAIDNPYLFTGRRWETETGLYFYRTRYYSPDLGRFIHRDPLGFVDGLSKYEYALNNPTNWVDPLGLSSNPCDRPWWEGALDGLQTGLDVLGLVPGLGEPFDLINAGIYGARGDYLNAGLSLAGMIPIGGQAATAGKFAAKYGDDLVGFGLKHGDEVLGAVPKKPPIIIGENMKRVREYADQVGGDVYRPWKNDPFDFDLAMRRNERWIKDMKRQGREIIDIGPDFNRRLNGRNPSDFYNMERRNLKGYSNYDKAFTRNGRHGGVPGLDF